MEKWVIVALLIFCLGFMTVSLFPEESKDLFDDLFAKGFKTFFIRSCQRADSSEEKRNYCECCADQAIAELTVKQLADFKSAAEHIKKNIVPGCRDKYLRRHSSRRG